MPARKVKIRWLRSNDPTDFDDAYEPQMWPERQLRGDFLSPGTVCKTTCNRKTYFVLLVDDLNDVESSDDDGAPTTVRFADIGAPPWSAVPIPPTVQRQYATEKGPDFVPEETKETVDSDNEKDEDMTPHLEPEGQQRRKGNRDNWKSNVRKRKFTSGQAHINSKGIEVPDKVPKIIDHPTACKLSCSTLSEDERLSVCRAYWDLADRQRQRDWILANVTVTAAAVHKVGAKERSCRRQYNLPFGDEKRRVCRQFFCATLAISYNVVLHSFKHASDHNTYEHADVRGKHKPKACTDDQLNFVPSHVSDSDEDDNIALSTFAK